MSICRLNPLSTGKSVQTQSIELTEQDTAVLIPYLQGSLFRLMYWQNTTLVMRS